MRRERRWRVKGRRERKTDGGEKGRNEGERGR
jgi:hypothetical protein